MSLAVFYIIICLLCVRARIIIIEVELTAPTDCYIAQDAIVAVFL